jgi:PII-like signaling protein
MTLEGPAVRLTIFVGESDQHGHQPLARELIHRAHTAGLAGATVLRGVEGFGASNHVHTTSILRLSGDLPVMIVLVDTAEKIDAWWGEVEELVAEGLVVREDVQVLRYRGHT